MVDVFHVLTILLIRGQMEIDSEVIIRKTKHNLLSNFEKRSLPTIKPLSRSDISYGFTSQSLLQKELYLLVNSEDMV